MKSKKQLSATKPIISNSLKNDKIAKTAITKLGVNNQREMLVEECSELIMSIQKLKRTEENVKKYKVKLINELTKRYENFVEEMADVSILILQFRKSDDNLNEKFNKYFNSKMNRLNKRIESN